MLFNSIKFLVITLYNSTKSELEQDSPFTSTILKKI